MKNCPKCKQIYEDSVEVCSVDGSKLVDTAIKDELIGRILKDSYRIEESIAAGGMGAVYRATQLQLDRNVGVKVILSNLRNNPNVVERFFREAKLLSQLYHPNVVSIIDFGMTEEGTMFMVMEYLVGKELFQYVPEDKGMGLEEIVGVMQQICAGMAAAHHLHLVHRDLKPSNVFIARVTETATVVKILDFGLVKGLDQQGDTMTRSGEIMGTPGYISPEQIRLASSADFRSDIYALGGILYFMMSGHRPYVGINSYACFEAQISGPPPEIEAERYREPEVAKLMSVVYKAMSLDPNDRYQSSTDLYRAIVDTAGIKGRLPDPARPVYEDKPPPATRRDGDSWGLQTISGETLREPIQKKRSPSPASGKRSVGAFILGFAVALALSALLVFLYAREIADLIAPN